jgi:hypothetical protein
MGENSTGDPEQGLEDLMGDVSELKGDVDELRSAEGEDVPRDFVIPLVARPVDRRTINQGKCMVPTELNPTGLYALIVQLVEESFFPASSGPYWMKRYFLYDRGEKILVDITYDLTNHSLSETRLSEVLPFDSVDTYEKFLTGADKPTYSGSENDPVSGIGSFYAQELIGPKYVPLQERMIALRDAQAQFESTSRAFREQARTLKIKKVPPQKVSP